MLPRFNYVHCGVEIVSMSKICMNGVFGCADDCNVNIYHQDTYAIHWYYEDVNKIVNRGKDKYNKDLVGENLGNVIVMWTSQKKMGMKMLMILKACV